MAGLFLFGNARPIGASMFSGIQVEHDGLGAAMYESWCEYQDIRGRSEVALACAYENYIMNTSQTEEQKVALYEGVLGDVWEKIKAFFKKVAAKIKSWWNAAVKFFQSHFQSDEEFIKKYKDELEAKDISKFSCTMHTWPGVISKECNEAKSIFEKASEEWNEVVQSAPDKVSDSVKESKKRIDAYYYKLVKGENAGKGGMGKFKDALKKSIMGKEKETKGLPSGITVSGMISALENGKDCLSELQNLATDIADKAEEYADGVDKAVAKMGEGDKDNEHKGENTRVVNGAVDAAKYALSYGSATLDVIKSCMTTQLGEYRSVLGAILRYSEPSKESSGYIWGSNNKTSLMDAFSVGF